MTENNSNNCRGIVVALKANFLIVDINYKDSKEHAIDQLSEKIKIDRLREINNLVEKTAKKRNLRYKDSLQEILVESINYKDNSQLLGRTRTNRLTFFPKSSIDSKSPQPGEIVNIKINKIRPFSLTGNLL